MLKQLKSILALSLMFVAVSSFGQQQMQQKKTPEQRAQNQIRWMQNNLSLTDDQNKKVYDILLTSAKAAENVVNMPAGQDRRAAREDVQRNRETQLKAVLTGDQYAKYQAHMDEMKAKMKERNTQARGDDAGF